MMGRTHLASALPVSLGYAAFVGAPVVMIPFIVIMTLIGVVIPDLDCKQSIASKSIPLVTDFISWVLRHTSKVVYVLSKGHRDEDYEGTHRHLTHTVAFAAGVSVGLYFLLRLRIDHESAVMLATAFGIGCFTHDLGDSLTIMGCPFLWPLPIAGETWYEIRPPEFLRFRTNGPFERWIMFPGLVGLGIYLIPGVRQVVNPTIGALWASLL